jgi:magnesium chelatase family protein
MTTDEARQAIAGARSLQEKRLAGREGRSNARIPASDLETLCATTAEARSLFRAALERHLVSARGYARCLRVARTIADLEGAEVIGQEHAAESLGYRNSGPAEGEADPNRDSGQNRPRAGPDRTSSGRIDHHNYLP